MASDEPTAPGHDDSTGQCRAAIDNHTDVQACVGARFDSYLKLWAFHNGAIRRRVALTPSPGHNSTARTCKPSRELRRRRLSSATTGPPVATPRTRRHP